MAVSYSFVNLWHNISAYLLFLDIYFQVFIFINEAVIGMLVAKSLCTLMNVPLGLGRQLSAGSNNMRNFRALVTRPDWPHYSLLPETLCELTLESASMKNPSPINITKVSYLIGANLIYRC